jgi:hypothetical protein
MRDFTQTRVRRMGMTLETDPYPRTTLFVAHPGNVLGERFTNQEVMEVLTHAAACWNAVRDALAEYDKQDSTGQVLPRAADRMADILRSALNA